jgi:hypothetical protein
MSVGYHLPLILAVAARLPRSRRLFILNLLILRATLLIELIEMAPGHQIVIIGLLYCGKSSGNRHAA